MKSLVPFFVIAFLGVGCAKTYEVDPELEPYVRSFENYGGFKVDDLVAGFGDTTTHSPKTVGLCKPSSPPEIIISREYWERSDNLRREGVMFHELAHCILDRGHVDTVVQGCPKSIMHPHVLPRRCYSLWRDEYIEELFYD